MTGPRCPECGSSNLEKDTATFGDGWPEMWYCRECLRWEPRRPSSAGCGPVSDGAPEVTP